MPDNISTPPKILVNAIRCPDGTILRSKHRHDFQQHTQEDGRYYAVDGGNDYCRIVASDNYYDWIGVYSGDPHEDIRKCFTWTSYYDADMNPIEPVEKTLESLTDSHIANIIKWIDNNRSIYPEYILKVFLDEQSYRKSGGQL